MKNLTLILGIICFLANAIIGMVITSYAPFNVIINSIVILVNTALMYLLASSSVKDGFKISLTMLFPLFALIEFVLGVLAPSTIDNNWYVIIITIILVIEGSLFAICNTTSKI